MAQQRRPQAGVGNFRALQRLVGTVLAGALRGVVVGAAPGHPLTPFVVGNEGESEDDEDEDGEGEFHSGRDQETRDQGLGTRD